MDFYSTVEAIFGKGKDIIITWFSVLTRGPNAFEKVDLEKSSTLIYALQFMFFMAFVDVVTDFPLLAKIGGSILTKLAVPPVLVVEAYIEYLMTALILHGSMKLVGGKGRLQPCTTVFCFLTAYFPLIGILMLPTRMITATAIPQGSNAFDASVAALQSLALSPSKIPGFVLSFLLTTIVLVLFFRAVFQNFRVLHKLSKARTIIALIVGLIGWAAFMAIFIEPSLSAITRALGAGAGS